MLQLTRAFNPKQAEACFSFVRSTRPAPTGATRRHAARARPGRGAELRAKEKQSLQLAPNKRPRIATSTPTGPAPNQAVGPRPSPNGCIHGCTHGCPYGRIQCWPHGPPHGCSHGRLTAVPATAPKTVIAASNNAASLPRPLAQAAVKSEVSRKDDLNAPSQVTRWARERSVSAASTLRNISRP